MVLKACEPCSCVTLERDLHVLCHVLSLCQQERSRLRYAQPCQVGLGKAASIMSACGYESVCHDLQTSLLQVLCFCHGSCYTTGIIIARLSRIMSVIGTIIGVIIAVIAVAKLTFVWEALAWTLKNWQSKTHADLALCYCLGDQDLQFIRRKGQNHNRPNTAKTDSAQATTHNIIQFLT